MTGAARVDPAAVEEVARALVRYGTAEEAVMAQAESAIRVVRGRVTAEQRRRRGALDAAEADLRACRGRKDADCSEFLAAVGRARKRLDAAQQAMRQVEAAATRFQAAKAKHTAVVHSLVQNGRIHLDRKAEELSAYTAGGSGGSGGSSGGGGGNVQREVGGMILKEFAVQFALFALLEGAGRLNANLKAPGVDQLIEQAITTVRSPGAAQVMAGTMRQALRFDQLGAAVADVRRRLRGS